MMRRTLPLIAAATLIGGGIGAAIVAVARTGPSGDRTVVASTVSVPYQPVPSGEVRVVTETVRLASGFTSRHQHGGLTVNVVRSGLVEITDTAGVARRYAPGQTFSEPAGRVHTLRVIDAVRMDVVRVLPPGAVATTEVA